MDFHERPLLNSPDLLLVLLKVASSGEAALEDAVARLKADLARAREDSGVSDRELAQHLELPRRHLAEARLLAEMRNGRFRITERGRRILADHPMGVDDTVLIQFREFRDFLRRSTEHAPPEDAGNREFTQGYAAFLAGRSHSDNPHRFDTAKHLAWECGWFEARDDHAPHRTAEGG